MGRDKIRQALTWAKYYAENRETLLAKQKVTRSTEEYRSKTRVQRAIYRQKNREVIRAKRREYMRQVGGKYRYRYPEKVLVRHIVKNAIRRGELTRQNCWCGEEGQAHHTDYSKPYRIMWLCRKHHAEVHRKYR